MFGHVVVNNMFHYVVFYIMLGHVKTPPIQHVVVYSMLQYWRGYFMIKHAVAYNMFGDVVKYNMWFWRGCEKVTPVGVVTIQIVIVIICSLN